MSNIKSYKLVFSIMAVWLFPFVAEAFLPLPPGPITPTIDAPGDAALGAESTMKQIKSGIDSYQQKQSEILGQIKATDIKIPLKLDTSFFNKDKGQPNLPSARTIEESQIADIKDEESIVSAFKKLFLTYPVDILQEYPEYQDNVKFAYRSKSTEFSNDAMIEMYITVRELEERMLALKQEFDSLSACFVQGQEQNSSTCENASPNDEELGIWSNYYKLNVIYDSLLKVTEELMAIRAQYEVAQAIRAGIEPEYPKTDENNGTEKVSFSFGQTQHMAFAQVMTAKELPAQKLETAVSKSAETMGGIVLTNHNAEAEKADPKLQVVKAKTYDVSSPLAGTAKQFQALAKSNNVYRELQTAQEAHNLKQQLPDYRNLFVEFDKMKQLHDKAVEHLKSSEDCVISYLENYYANPVKIWLGEGCRYSGNKIVCNTGRGVTAEGLKNLKSGDKLCAEDSSKICSSFDINGYSRRGGFSGWLLSAYKAAKAEKVLSLTQDDFAAGLNDGQMSGNLADLEAEGTPIIAEVEAGASDSPFLRPSDEPKIEEANREQEILAWRIGAEGAKALAEDMGASPSKWGGAMKPYPMWNDEKYYYNQYLSRKYHNMEEYIRNLDLRDATAQLALKITNSLSGDSDAQILGVKLPEVKDYARKKIEAVQALLAKNTENSPEFNKFMGANVNAALTNSNARNSFKASMVSLSNKQNNIYSNLDRENLDLNEQKVNFNEVAQEKQFAEKNTDMQKEISAVAQARLVKEPSAESSFREDAEKEMASAAEKIEQSEKISENLLMQIDDKRTAIDELNLQLQQSKDDIVRARSDYAAKASELEVRNENAVKKAAEEYAQSSDNISLKSSSYLKQALESKGGNLLLERAKKDAFMEIVSYADNLVSQAKDYAIEQISDGHRKILDLEQERFDPKAHKKIVDIHQQMINKLKKPDITNTVTSFALSGLLKTSQVKSLLDEIYLKAVINAICANDSCYKIDSEYFVGLPPKARDFTAPKAINGKYVAPLREIVHFDNVDYANVIKSDQLYTTRREFLDYGQEMPDVWRRILMPDGFVESSVDIQLLLRNNEAAGDILMRGGSYPCTVGKYNIDIAAGGFYVYNAKGKKPFCRDIKSLNIYYTDDDKKTGHVDLVLSNGEKTVGSYGKALDKRSPSELSLLLSYQDGLTFSNKIQQIMAFYDAIEDEDNTNDYGFKGKMYEKAVLARNQFGNFLNFVELEEVYQKAVEELQSKVDENREELSKKFAKFDYIPEKDFDLADDATFEQLLKILDDAKNQKVASAVSQLKDISPENEVIEEKLAKINNMLSALQLDNEELVKLSDNMNDQADLAEKIKSMQADKNVMEKYDQQAQEEFEKNLNNFEQPYCAVYE